MRSTRGIRSPNRREAIAAELSEHTTKMQQLMQADITYLEEENAKLRDQCTKVEQMSDKVEIVVNHNKELTLENQKLQRLLEEKLDEIKSLKMQKSDNKNWQIERANLFKEIQYLRHRLDQSESMRNLTIHQIEKNHKFEIQKIMEGNEKGIILFQKQLIRLKQKLDNATIHEKDLLLQIDKKQQKIIGLFGELQQKDKNNEEYKVKVQNLEKELSESNSEANNKFTALKLERDQLKQNLQDFDQKNRQLKQELDRHKKSAKINEDQLQNSISKLKTDNRQIRQQLSDKLSQIDELTKNNRKIKQLIDQKQLYITNRQEMINSQVNQIKKCKQKIQELNLQIEDNKQKIQELNGDASKKNLQISQLQNKLDILQSNNSELKIKMRELAVLNDGQVNDLKNKLQEIYNNEIIDIKMQAERVEKLMAEDIAGLQDELSFKNLTIHNLQQQLAQQIQLKQKFLSEGQLIKDDLTALHLQNQQIQMKNFDKIKNLQSNVRTLTIQIGQKTQQLRQKSSALQDEKKKTSELQQQLNQISNRYDYKVSKLQKQVQNWKQKYEEVKMINHKFSEQSNSQKADIIRQFKQKISSLEQQLQKWKERFTKLQSQNTSLKDCIRKRDKSIGELEDKIPYLHKQLEQRQETIDQLRNAIIQKQRNLKQKYEQKKSFLQENIDSKLNQQQQIYETKIIVLQNQLEITRKNLREREIQIDELLKQYKKLREGLNRMVDQSAQQKQYSLKFPGATADLIATKNMFDVFIKTKVLEFCGDAVGQQNKQNRRQ